MGTKNNPGSFDCHHAAEDDEPLFTLLARDPLAPYLVAAWAEMRMGNPAKVHEIIRDMIGHETERYYLKPDTPKAIEALTCANSMSAWRLKHRPDPSPIADRLSDAVSGRLDVKPATISAPTPICRCGLAACPQCDTTALESGFIHQGP